MIRLTVISGKTAGCSLAVRRFPFHIGRSAGNDLVLEEAGVWERHLTLEFQRQEGIRLLPGSGALLSVNSEPVDQPCRLRNGDLIALGAVKLQFFLSSPVQRALLVREALVWGLLVAVFAAQTVWLSCYLPH